MHINYGAAIALLQIKTSLSIYHVQDPPTMQHYASLIMSKYISTCKAAKR